MILRPPAIRESNIDKYEVSRHFHESFLHRMPTNRSIILSVDHTEKKIEILQKTESQLVAEKDDIFAHHPKRLTLTLALTLAPGV